MMTSQQPQQNTPQAVNSPDTVAAWVKCPSCGGVLGVPLGSSQGPCVFCNSTIQVATIVRLAPQQIQPQAQPQIPQQPEPPRQHGAFPVNQNEPVRLNPADHSKRLDRR